MVDVDGDNYAQRFYRARPTALPLYPSSTYHNSPSTPTSTPKANDSRNRVAPSYRDSPYNQPDWSDSPGSRTWTSRERIKAATCLALSRDGRYLAVGETGYAPRVLIFSLQDASSDTPLVSITEHAFGVKCVAWSADSKWLASLGSANDGFLYVWRIDPRTGAAKLFQQNRCTSFIRAMVWMGNSLITLGVRHVKIWKVEEPPTISPTKQKFMHEPGSVTPTPQKTLPGRNVLLGSLLEATFTCAVVDGKRLIICTEAGDVCILDDDDRQLKLLKVLNVGFQISSITIRNDVAYVGGKNGSCATLDVPAVMDGQAASVLSTTESPHGLIALGFLTDKLVTVDAQQSIEILSADCMPGQSPEAATRIPIPGQGDSILGIQPTFKPNKLDSDFLTWSATGNVTFWDLQGRVKSSLQVDIELPSSEDEYEPINQLACVRVSPSGNLLVTADQLGILKATDVETKESILDTKAHASHCMCISLHEDGSKFLMACCGRDRIVQLFHRRPNGTIEHFQTLEFAARVVQVLTPAEGKVITCSLDRTLQVHELIARPGDDESLAAIPSKVISLRASPTSMTMGPENKTVLVSLVDRSVCQFDLSTGRQINAFKCVDEGGAESAILESLSMGHWPSKNMDFLLGLSNTDKSVRLYDTNSGAFLDREWGHTEAINGVALLDDHEGGQKVVSVGSDGTIMVWALDLNDPSPIPPSRDPSPAKEASGAARPTLRRVLSKAELAEFQRSQSPAGRRSPPRTLQRRTSRFNLAASVNSIKTPTAPSQTSPGGNIIAENTPSRRPSADSRVDSPPASPKSRIRRRPSLPALGISGRKKVSSAPTLNAYGSLNSATEQTCRTLRAYRKKLASSEPISTEALSELDQELRLTAAALGERAIRSKAMNETVLSGLLDQYSERLIALLDEKLNLTNQNKSQDGNSSSEEGPRSADGDISSSSAGA